jgi:osmoprotectant transport system permease protein
MTRNVPPRHVFQALLTTAAARLLVLVGAKRSAWTLLLAGSLYVVLTCAAAEPALEVGSKRFTESYLLGEIIADRVKTVTPAEHRAGLGNTAVTLAALKTGAIDCYPEYLGTIELEILKQPHAASSIDSINQALAGQGLVAIAPLGFADSYALAIDQELSIRLGVSRLSDLALHPELRIGLSQEFLGRRDGWMGLKDLYHLPQQPIGLDHGLAYSALGSKQIDVLDIYSTDARIASDHLVVLQDDQHYFPDYQAVILAKSDLAKRNPRAWQALLGLQGSVSQTRMIDMNRAVELGGQDFHRVAAAFVAEAAAGEQHPPSSANGSSATAPESSTPAESFWAKLFGPDLLPLTLQHLGLVSAAVAAAILVGLPLGIIASYHVALRSVILAVTGLLQTVPTLALLAFLIPMLGRIGTWPALLALFLYGLLPIVRNTVAGLAEVPAGLKEAGRALGLSEVQRLLLIELPLSARIIVAGIKTATVLAIGTATLAALIGAGGYGERITIGLALNDNAMLLAGAIPAALLALLAEFSFALVDRLFTREQRAKR